MWAGKFLANFPALILHKNIERSDFVTIRYCKTCNSRLDVQSEFSRFYSFWFCRYCGELLINPDVDLHDNKFPDVLWFCDCCGELMNVQEGFTDDVGFWVCDVCEHINEISEENVI